MEYAFVHEGIGYTPSGKLTLASKRVPSHNAECEAAELAAIEAGSPVVVYPEKNLCVALWTGIPVGTIVKARTFRNPFGGTLTAYTWRDHHGKTWHGRGAGDGMALISRRNKV
jgi:hypothetical protein